MTETMLFPGAQAVAMEEDLCKLCPLDLINRLHETGVIDEAAAAELRRLLALHIFHFRFHSLRCAETPRGPHYTGPGKIPWRRAGNAWLWAVCGDLRRGCLSPTQGEPDAVWLEVCLVA